MQTNNNLTAYEKVCTLITFMDRQVKTGLFMTSYGENEVRFYTNELHEPKLVEIIQWDRHSLDTVIERIRKVTTSI